MNKLKFILLPVVLLFVTGCSTGINSMLEDYNGNFTVDNDIMEMTPTPGDEDFDPDTMLMDTYCVGTHETLNLAGPYKCNSYEWIVTDPSDTSTKEEKPLTIKYFDGTTECYQRLFVTYIPESGLEAGKTYKLKLTVTDKEGNAYTDVCELVIYQHYDFK